MAGKGIKKTVNLKFIIPKKCKSQNETDDSMKMAFQECTEADLSPDWVPESQINDISLTKNTVVVLQEFAGTTFEKLRSSKSVRVCGPMCLRSCLADGLPIPENKSPVFTTAMRGVIVTASQVPPTTKTALKERVNFMGGIYVNNLIESVTHLLTNSVQSAKYELAGERGIHAMRTEWVEALWDESQQRNIRATDLELSRKFKCPVFFNMFVTTSNLSKPEKEEVKRLITENGGTFTTQMRQNETMLLIVNEPRGDKYKHARLWGVPCVKTTYLKESVRSGYALPTKNYLLEPSMRCSTPTKGEEIANFTCDSESGMISVINFESSKTNIDDTQATFCSMTSSQMRKTSKPSSGSQHGSIVESMMVSDAKKAGTFMDGCKIFLSGFSPTEGEKLRRILSLGGATVFSELSDSVSHVLIGEFIVNDMKALNEMAQKPHVVTVEWLTASMKQRSPVPEEPFYCMATNRVVPEPPSPLSQKGLQLLKPSDDSASAKMPPPAEPHVPRKLFSEFVKENTKSPAKTPQSTTCLPSANLSTLSTTAREESPIAEIFVGQKFLIAGFNSDLTGKMEEAIEESGGCVVAADFTGVADYAIVPLQVSTPNITAVEVVTSLWLEECWAMKEVVPIEYYHQPFPVAQDKQPLADCCISLSNYTGKEKVFLSDLIHILGATYQDVFARVAKQDKSVLVSTHLVCPVADGQKYKAAMRWNLPVVTKDWLLACAKQGVRVSETAFMVNVELTKTPEQNSKPSSAVAVQATPFVDLNQTPLTSKPNPPPVRSELCDTSAPNPSTPSYCNPQVTPGSSAGHSNHSNHSLPTTPTAHHPALNSLKRKSFAQTPDSDHSPFHVATPDTPYGQVFGTPTASSKKRWKQFIDDFPSKNVPTQVSPKKRRQSTPLSELKRRLVQMALGELGEYENAAELQALRQSIDNVDPNYSIEDMDDVPTANCQMEERLTPARSVKSQFTQSKQDRENVHPRRFSGRATPTVNDFSSEAEEAESSTSTPRSSTVTPPCKKPTNEAVSAMLGNLHKRLSSSTHGSHGDEPQLPQRELVSPSEQPITNSKPVASSLLPESQPILIGWEDPVESAERAKVLGSPADQSSTEKPPPMTRKFVLSNVAEREKYEQILMDLGETVITSQSYDSQTTHLIMDRPVRSEKLLCCLASGKWILHTSYVDEMVKQKGVKISEEDYEWGSEVSASRLPKLSGSTLEQQLAAAAVRWRRELQAKPGCGAFSDIRALLVVSPSKFESYQRLIQAGGGTIIPHSTNKEATHCFVEISKVAMLPVPISQLVARQVPCLPPVFLGDMLIKFPRPPEQDSLIAEYRALLEKKSGL